MPKSCLKSAKTRIFVRLAWEEKTYRIYLNLFVFELRHSFTLKYSRENKRDKRRKNKSASVTSLKKGKGGVTTVVKQAETTKFNRKGGRFKIHLNLLLVHASTQDRKIKKENQS